MTDIDKALRDKLREGQREAEVGLSSGFDAIWSGAESIVARRRRRTRFAGGIAAAVTLVTLGFVSQLPTTEQQWQFIDPDELASSTSWAAPSDILLPKHQFDIYEEIPVLIESTDRDGGTLL